MSRDIQFEAPDLRTFIRCLRRLGRKVGPRSGTNRRAKVDKELFCFRRYAATLAAHSQWTFPCTVSVGESPDFMIAFGDILHGLEVTEATTETFQRGLTQSEASDEECQLIEDDGWIGEAPERDWSEAVVRAIEAKVGLIPSYRRALCHDILVVSSHPADDMRHINGKDSGHVQLHALVEQRAPCWMARAKHLGTISVIDGSVLVFDLVNRREQWPIHDLRPVRS